MGPFYPNMDTVENEYVPKTVCFCQYGTFLLVTHNFHPFGIKRRLIFELICESAKIYAFQNQPAGMLIDVLFLPQYKLPNSCVPLTMSSLKNMCFQHNMCAEAILGELAINLVLISCKPLNTPTKRSHAQYLVEY